MKEARHNKSHVIFFLLYEISRRDQSTETGHKLVVAGMRGGDIQEEMLVGSSFLLTDKDILELDTSGHCTTLSLSNATEL